MFSPTRQTQELIVDGAAAATRAGEQDIRAWGREQRVFVSSLIDGFSEYRHAAAAAIRDIEATPIMFEDFGGRDSSPDEAYLSEVRASTVYVGLLAARYGLPLPDRYSATHKEFLEAEGQSIRTSVWVQSGVGREGPQQSFVDAVREFQVTGSYSSPEQLQVNLAERLRTIASQELAPWVKLGPIVFRATEIHESRSAATVHATVRQPDVANALRALANRGRGHQHVFSYSDRVLLAEIHDLQTTTRAGRSVDVNLEIGVCAPSRPTEMSFNGVPWAELTELGLRVSLFGEPNPFGAIARNMVSVTNPFPALRAAAVPEESVRPIARLLLSEIMVTERGVERITDFALGAAISGQRRLRLGWQAQSQYAGDAPTQAEVAGAVAW